jgi:hypothetical protein
MGIRVQQAFEGGRAVTDDNAIDVLAEILSKGATRKSFANDPEGTLRDRGVDPASLPAGVYDVLSDLSDTELRAIGRLKKAFDESGDVSSEQKLQMV